MITTKLQTDIHALSRREKYRLIHLLARDLEIEDVPRRDDLQKNMASPAPSQEASKAKAIDTFLMKWKGCLKGGNADEAKHRYIEEKYQ